MGARVYEAVGDAIAAEGVDTAFGVLGETNMLCIHRAVSEHGLRWVAAAREDGGVAMADGWSRVTGRVGLASCTCGPALTNTLTALTEAARARTPMVLLTGDVKAGAPWHPQVFDMAAAVLPTGAGYQRVSSPASASDDVAVAFRRAAQESRPIVCDVPQEMQSEACPLPEPVPRRALGAPGAEPDPAVVERLAGILAQAERPAIIAGHGALHAGRELAELADAIGAVLATSLRARGLFAGHPFAVGMSGGFASTVARRLVRQADCVLAFGASLNHWTTASPEVFGEDGGMLDPAATIVHCDRSPLAPGAWARADESVIGDAREVAARLTAAVPRPSGPVGFHTEAIREEIARHDPASEFEDAGDASGLDPRTVMLRLNGVLPERRLIAVDAGLYIFAAGRHLEPSEPGGFVHAFNFGAVGLGLATAIGCAVARPDLTAVSVLGDGGLAMSLQELDTVRAHGIDLVVVLVNDRAYGAEVENFRAEGLPSDLARFDRPDYGAIVRAFGGRFVTVGSAAELERLEALPDRPQGLTVIECRTRTAVA